MHKNIIYFKLLFVFIDRPDIAFNQNTYYIERSATVVLTCRVRNSLVVKWFKLDAHRTPNPILETQRHKIKTTPDQSLIITNVYSGDEGIYRCTASNRYGTSQADANLTVGGEFQLTLFYISIVDKYIKYTKMRWDVLLQFTSNTNNWKTTVKKKRNNFQVLRS